MRRVAALGLCLVMLAPSGASAQTVDPRSEAAALYNAQQATLNALPKTSPNAQVIPGYGGDAASLQGFADNAPGLASAGQGATVGSEIFQTTTAASNGAAAVAASNNDAWLQRSLAVVNDPSAYGGGSEGESASICAPTGGAETVTTETLYTCESGTRVTEESPTCSRVFTPDVSGESGQIGWSYYSCQEGWRDDPGSRTCDVPLQVTTSTQYKYECVLLSYCTNGANQELVRCGPFVYGGCTRTAAFVRRGPWIICNYVFAYTCPAPISGPFNNEVRIENKGTVPGTASASWNETACQALASDATCTLQSEVCIEGAGTRTVNGVSVYQSCWKKRRTYSCSAITQGAGCNPPAGAQFLTQTCLWSDAAGICRLFERTYRSVASVTNGEGTWIYDPACPAAGDGACGEAGLTCTEGAATRIVDGVAVTADCWKQAVAFQCTRAEGQGSDCDVRPGCAWKEDRCLDEACKSVEHVYSCSSSETQATSGTLCGAQICLGSQCYTLQDQTSSDLPAVFASLATLEAAGEDHNAGVTLFNGQSLRCKKAVLGFRNCCKDSGWGLDIGIANCDAQEKELAERQKAKACHYVGTWCSEDSFFGCLEKSMRYCCFEGVLGRIVQEAGRGQIGKGWGSAEHADCSGFTVEQFQQLDLSQVDFSEFTREAMKTLSAPGEGGTVGAIQQSLERLYQTGTPGTGG